MSTSSKSTTLSSFNPHAVHPFTAGTSQPPAHHHSTRTPNSSSHPSQAQNIPTYHSAGSSSSQQPGYASSATSTPVHSPQPRPASKNPSSSQPIFTPFKLERSSPELRDILAKRGKTPAWSVKPSNNSSQGPKSSTNGKK